MEWKKDWDDAKQRLTAWWRGEVLDRVSLAVYAPANESRFIYESTEKLQEAEAPKTFKERRTSILYRILATEHKMANIFYGGEAFPCFNTEIGPGDLALFLGSEPFFHVDTEVVWYQPSITDPEKSDPLTFDQDNYWWKFHRQLIAEAVKHSQGRYLVGVPDLIECLDTLASLRGHTQLILDLFRRPKWVHERLREITDLYFIYFEKIYETIRDEVGGNAFSLYSIWGPGRTTKIQCDFSARISPAMFKEFALPYLQKQCSRLDFTLYHLDGPDALHHLDQLLKISELSAIQWVPGAGNLPNQSPHWYPLYRKILRSGKRLWLSIPPDHVRKTIDVLGEKGLFIITRTNSEKEAHQLLRQIGQSYS